MSIQHTQLDILNSANRILQILRDLGAVGRVREKARWKFSSCPYLKTFVSPFLPTWLTAPGSPRMNHCNADRTTWKLTLQDINMTPKEPKTEQDHTHRQLFHYYCSSSVWRNNQRKLWWKISAHSALSPNLELSTPTELRHSTCLMEGKSPSVKLGLLWDLNSPRDCAS